MPKVINYEEFSIDSLYNEAFSKFNLDNNPDQILIDSITVPFYFLNGMDISMLCVRYREIITRKFYNLITLYSQEGSPYFQNENLPAYLQKLKASIDAVNGNIPKRIFNSAKEYFDGNFKDAALNAATLLASVIVSLKNIEDQFFKDNNIKDADGQAVTHDFKKIEDDFQDELALCKSNATSNLTVFIKTETEDYKSIPDISEEKYDSMFHDSEYYKSAKGEKELFDKLLKEKNSDQIFEYCEDYIGQFKKWLSQMKDIYDKNVLRDSEEMGMYTYITATANELSRIDNLKNRADLKGKNENERKQIAVNAAKHMMNVIRDVETQITISLREHDFERLEEKDRIEFENIRSGFYTMKDAFIGKEPVKEVEIEEEKNIAPGKVKEEEKGIAHKEVKEEEKGIAHREVKEEEKGIAPGEVKEEDKKNPAEKKVLPPEGEVVEMSAEEEAVIVNDVLHVEWNTNTNVKNQDMSFADYHFDKGENTEVDMGKVAKKLNKALKEADAATRVWKNSKQWDAFHKSLFISTYIAKVLDLIQTKTARDSETNYLHINNEGLNKDVYNYIKNCMKDDPRIYLASENEGDDRLSFLNLNKVFKKSIEDLQKNARAYDLYKVKPLGTAFDETTANVLDSKAKIKKHDKGKEIKKLNSDDLGKLSITSRFSDSSKLYDSKELDDKLEAYNKKKNTEKEKKTDNPEKTRSNSSLGRIM